MTELSALTHATILSDRASKQDSSNYAAANKAVRTYLFRELIL